MQAVPFFVSALRYQLQKKKDWFKTNIKVWAVKQLEHSYDIMGFET
jgi:hypothetical protein